jgi:MoCo/4Fe-4S cofactor protein with predicted Tat translocation signal
LPPIKTPQPDEVTMPGQAYWRSLEELADTPQFRELVANEFAGYDPEQIRSLSRRRFMQLMAASMSLAGLTLSGCRRYPETRLAPFVTRPDGRVPGTTRQFASITQRGGVAAGLLVSSFDGRPIKVEGNPLHPYSLGATDVFAQASILELYDPARSREVFAKPEEGENGSSHEKQSWNEFKKFVTQRAAQLGQGEKFAVLSEISSSPSLAAMKARLLAKYPQAKWYTYEPINRDNEVLGSQDAFGGQALRGQYDLSKAKVIAALDSDLLHAHPAALRHARDWAAGRRSADEGQMNRLYVVEATYSVTGSVADERLPIQAGRIAAVVMALAERLGIDGIAPTGLLNGASGFVESLAKDLLKHRGQSVVVVGPNQPAPMHALAWAINQKLGNLGKTITLIEDPTANDNLNRTDIGELTKRAGDGDVDTLLLLGGNAAYDAPAGLDLAAALDNVDTAIHLSLYQNETSQHCSWQLPLAHELESWSDGRAWDGSVSIGQPLIHPLHQGRTAIEVLALVLGDKVDDGYDIVRRTFGQWLSAMTFEKQWRKALHDGVLEGSALPAVKVAAVASGMIAVPVLSGDGYEVVFNPDPCVYDGRYANNGWLQELPDAMTKVTWDNVVALSITDAQELGIVNGDIVKIELDGREVEGPAYLMPGQARKTIGLTLGYGRTAAGPVGTEVGFDSYKIRALSATGFTGGATMVKTGANSELALTQNHYLLDAVGMKGRRERVGVKGGSGPIVREATLNEYEHDRHFVTKGQHFGDVPLQLWEGPAESKAKRPGGPKAFNTPHAWGMSVDMNTCIGCNACVVACQAENNIPVVGKDQVLMHREMHWIRIDRYFKTDTKLDPGTDHPEVVHMPVMCQHCENAPCEQVCPVAATTHDTEGLNVMVYNRCIGTRYCSNNCPYKVRRFNYFDYHSKNPRGMAKPWLGMPDTQQNKTIDGIKKMVFNPQVTVRMRGVMEKCTYCTQRIAAAKIDARNAWAKGKAQQDDSAPQEPTVADGQMVTACQQVCPTQAIVFGDLNDANSAVTRAHENDRSYGILTELNTRPRTRYIAKLRNPSGKGPISSTHAT